VIVEVDGEREEREYPVDRLRFKKKQRKDNVKLTAAEMKELKALEDREGKSKLDDN
jgi:hypothetical protein